MCSERTQEIGRIHGAGTILLPVAHESLRSWRLDNEEEVVVCIWLVAHDDPKELEAVGLMVDTGNPIQLRLELVEGGAPSVPGYACLFLSNELIDLA